MLLLLPVFLSVIAGCDLLRTEVIRDVRGAYAEDGESLLIVQSRYKTMRPSNPHFADQRARDWMVFLYEAEDPGNPSEGRRLLASFPEGIQYDSIVATGGGAQYSMVFWNKAKGFVVFSEANPFIYRLDDGSARPLEVGTARLRQAIQTHPRLNAPSRPAELTPDLLANILTPTAAIPSPDGQLIALQYFSVLQEGASVFDPFAHYRLVVFLDSDNLEIQGTSWVTGNPWNNEALLDSWELAGEDETGNYSNMAWLPDSSGVLYYLGFGDSPPSEPSPEGGVALIPAPASPVNQNIPSTIVYSDGSIECQGCSGTDPSPVMFDVPLRPVPGSGGPVSRDGGRVVILTYPQGQPGNATRLESLAYDWQGPGLPAHTSGEIHGPIEDLLLPADDWFNWLGSQNRSTSRFNFLF